MASAAPCPACRCARRYDCGSVTSRSARSTSCYRCGLRRPATRCRPSQRSDRGADRLGGRDGQAGRRSSEHGPPRQRRSSVRLSSGPKSTVARTHSWTVIRASAAPKQKCGPAPKLNSRGSPLTVKRPASNQSGRPSRVEIPGVIGVHECPNPRRHRGLPGAGVFAAPGKSHATAGGKPVRVSEVSVGTDRRSNATQAASGTDGWSRRSP
jgi:hypothetical protein